MSMSAWCPLVARIGTGMTLVIAGLIKIADLDQAARTVVAYRLITGSAARLVGGALPFIEVIVGLLLALGLGTRLSAATAGALFLLYAAAIGSVWARGLSIDCGCFGGGGDVQGVAWRGYVADLSRDLVALLATAYLVRHPSTRCSLDRLIRI